MTFRYPRRQYLSRPLNQEEETYGPFIALIIAALLTVGGLLYTFSGHGPLVASNIERMTPGITGR